jgi:glycosyltransferase involved in cell wall biosynthesis
VVQVDYGGHPVTLAEAVWPIAATLGKPRVFVFDANDPFPTAPLGESANPVRRAARRKMLDRRIEFCRAAIAEADLVITHNRNTAHRFRDVWDESRCHELLPPPAFGDELLLSATQIESSARERAARQQTLRLLCLGRSADHAIRALAHCRRLSVPATLTVVAGDPIEPMRAMADGLAMGEFVRFVDAAVGPSGLGTLGEHDVLISAEPLDDQPQETFDPTILVAMARGLAVISYERSSSARILESNEAATIVPSQNVLLLAQAIIDLQQNRRRLITLAESGWRFAASRTLEATHRRRIELVGRLLRPRTVRRSAVPVPGSSR